MLKLTENGISDFDGWDDGPRKNYDDEDDEEEEEEVMMMIHGRMMKTI